MNTTKTDSMDPMQPLADAYFQFLGYLWIRYLKKS